MFHWCQNVSVYNVENHYHFYADQQIQDHQQPSTIVGRSFQKLKPAPISITASTNVSSKRNAKSCSKKGLNLSKTLDQTLHAESGTNPKQEKNAQKTGVMCVGGSAYSQHIRSATVSESDIAKTRSIESSAQLQSPSITVIPSSHIDNSNEQIPQLSKAHTLHSKRKPSVSVTNSVALCKQENNLLLTHLYSTRCNFNRSSTYTNLGNFNPNANAIGIGDGQAEMTFINSNSRSKNLLDISPIRGKDETPELTTSRNLCSRERTDSQYNQSQSAYGFNNSRYNVSRSQSMSMDVEQEPNERFYFRIMEMSRGEARQASIILSNILSRSGQGSYSYCSNTQRMPHARIAHERKRIFQDKQTILSQNDALSDSSIKVEESELCDMDPRNNFTLLKNKTITHGNYTMELAIENHMRCIVSLKEIGFREMSAISQQLQMYEFLEQKLASSDTFRNILQLYQVQMANGSYMLIKQPYTHGLFQYLHEVPQPNRPAFVQQVKQMIGSLLNQFAHHLIYPSRALNIIDFVVCESVVKFHDLSVFRQMKDPMYSVAEIVEQFGICFQL